MQYAGTHLKTPLFVVLGHEGAAPSRPPCRRSSTARATGAGSRSSCRTSCPALDGMDPAAPPEERMRAAVEANVRWTIRRIRATPEAQAREAEGIMKLVGAVLSLSTGVVRFLEE